MFLITKPPGTRSDLDGLDSGTFFVEAAKPAIFLSAEIVNDPGGRFQWIEKPDPGTQFCSGSRHTFGIQYVSQERRLTVHFDARIKIQFETGVFLPNIRLLGVDL